VNDLYYPAWHVRINGKESNIIRGFTSLRAIPVASGLSTVELFYEDPAFEAGWKVSLATILLSLLVILIGKNEESRTFIRDPSLK
jgi:uncharacterized membrane protein YfhO